jgi:hypothetical protein
MDEIDEIFIQYKSNNEALEKFIEKFKEKRILIKLSFEDLVEFIDSSIQVDFIKAVIDKYEANVAIILPEYEFDGSRKVFDIFKEKEIPVFFSTMVHSWDVLTGLADMGVSDIYIVEELGFELVNAAAVLHERGIQIRCYPNVAQSAHPNVPDIKKFFIRPEDVERYARYVDVFEFYGDNNNLYYKIYAKDKKWFGDLSEIIFNFNKSLDSRCVVTQFAEVRSRCGKKCMKGSPCKICEKVDRLAETMQENGLYFRKIQETEIDNE